MILAIDQAPNQSHLSVLYTQEVGGDMLTFRPLCTCLKGYLDGGRCGSAPDLKWQMPSTWLRYLIFFEDGHKGLS